MPIHTSWKSMAGGMRKTYCEGSKDEVCRDFTDGSKLCLCKKAWSVFFATMRKHGWKEGSPRHPSVSETVFNEAIEETISDIVEWYESLPRTKCMECSKSPTVEVLWANGKAHAWFCENCFKAWKEKTFVLNGETIKYGDEQNIDEVRPISNGVASKKW